MNKKAFHHSDRIMIIILLLIPSCTPSGFSQSLKDDKKFLELQSNLPAGWHITNTTDQIKIMSSDSVWSMFENKISQPKMTEPDSVRISRIKKYGIKVNPCFTLRYEPKWSKQKLDNAKKTNANIYKQIDSMANTTGVKKLIVDPKTTKGELWFNAKTHKDSLLVKDYLKFKETQENKLIKLPDYETSFFSIFQISEVGISDAFTTVYPYTESEKAYKIMSLMQELWSIKP
jgi:hypothetical protein